MNGFLLDTNILSEIRRGEKAHPAVIGWYEQAQHQQLFLSVLFLTEIWRGIELRRLKDPLAAQSLERWLVNIEAKFSNQFLTLSGKLCVRQKLPPIDGLLAATALHHDLTLVTRNTADVARSGVACVNPFTAKA